MPINKPKVTTVKKVTAPSVKRVKAETPSWKRVDAQVGKAPIKPRAGTALQQGAVDALAKAKAIIEQLKTFNPNSWGAQGPGHFQGMDTPKPGQSIQDIINNARR